MGELFARSGEGTRLGTVGGRARGSSGWFWGEGWGICLQWDASLLLSMSSSWPATTCCSVPTSALFFGVEFRGSSLCRLEFEFVRFRLSGALLRVVRGGRVGPGGLRTSEGEAIPYIECSAVSDCGGEPPPVECRVEGGTGGVVDMCLCCVRAGMFGGSPCAVSRVGVESKDGERCCA